PLDAARQRHEDFARAGGGAVRQEKYARLLGHAKLALAERFFGARARFDRPSQEIGGFIGASGRNPQAGKCDCDQNRLHADGSFDGFPFNVRATNKPAARSISSVVVNRPTLNRTAPWADSAGTFLAARTGEIVSLPS